MVSIFRRAQIRIDTIEGESVTSTQLEFNDVENEYITVDSIEFLFGKTHEEVLAALGLFGVAIQDDYGIEWVNVMDIMPMLKLTPSR